NGIGVTSRVGVMREDRNLSDQRNIILFHPKTLHEKYYSFFWLPYSVLYIGSALKQNGFKPILFDENVIGQIGGMHYQKTFEPLLSNCLFVGISSMTGHQLYAGLKFAKKIRESNPFIPIVWGGRHGTLMYETMVENPFVDIVIRGQGEKTVVELSKRLLENNSLFGLDGLSFKSNGRIIHNKPREFIDMESFRPIEWNLIDIVQYILDDPDINTRSLNYISSLGCPHRCGFCTEVPFVKDSSRKWMGFKAESVVHDISYLTNKYQINGIKFYDANFFVDPTRVLTFASGLIKRSIEIKWAASAHPITIMKLKNEDWKIIKKSGCSRLLIGIESGSQKVLDLINKTMDVSMGIEIADRLTKYGIIGCFTFIVGFPNAPKDEIDLTLEMANKIREIFKKHEVKIHFYGPYPRTPLFDIAVNNGFTPPKTLMEWAKFDYYTIEVPWVDKSYKRKLDMFNREGCPYVHI
ncbi:MAG: B12-binding domain-containing radical SAM protein, partial [bacterium]